MLDSNEIAVLQGQKKTYVDMGYNNILETDSVKMPEFVSADDFSALTSGFKGGRLSIDNVKGQILIRRIDGNVGAVIGVFD